MQFWQNKAIAQNRNEFSESPSASHSRRRDCASHMRAARLICADPRNRPPHHDQAHPAAARAAALSGHTGAHSAIELALLDLAGRAATLPAINLIGGALRRAVAPMWLLGNATPAEDAAEARAKLAEGFRFFKVKVGGKSGEGDIASTLAVRNALGH